LNHQQLNVVAKTLDPASNRNAKYEGVFLAPEQPGWAKLHPRSRWSGVARHEVSFSTLVDVVLCVSHFISGTEVERRGPDYCVGPGRFLSWCDGMHHLRKKTLEIASGLPEAD
jgi:hypothetical protein